MAAATSTATPTWYQLVADEACGALDVDPATGLCLRGGNDNAGRNMDQTSSTSCRPSRHGKHSFASTRISCKSFCWALQRSAFLHCRTTGPAPW